MKKDSLNSELFSKLLSILQTVFASCVCLEEKSDVLESLSSHSYKEDFSSFSKESKKLKSFLGILA